MDVIFILAAFALGAYIGYRVSTALFAISFKNIMDDLGITEQQLRRVAAEKGIDLGPEEAAQEPTLTPIEIKLEERSGQIYAYRMDNDQFLGQGANREELVERLALTMTNVRLIVSEGSELITPA